VKMDAGTWFCNRAFYGGPYNRDLPSPQAKGLLAWPALFCFIPNVIAVLGVTVKSLGKSITGSTLVIDPGVTVCFGNWKGNRISFGNQYAPLPPIT